MSEAERLAARLTEADEWFDGKRVYEVQAGCSIEYAKRLVKLKAAAQDAAALLRTPAPPPAPADGWRCVPVEPTDEMVMAGCTGYSESASSTHYGMITEAWHCILAASPSPPHAEEP